MENEEEKIPTDAEQVKALAMKSASGLDNPATQMRVESAMEEEERMLTPAQGLDATDALTRFDAVQSEGMKKYRKMMGSGDANGVRLFMARHGGEMAKKRNALARVVAAEARHGFEQSIKDSTESDARRLAECDISEGTATTLEQSLDAETTNESMNSSLSETDGWHEFMEHQIDRSEDMSEEEKDVARGTLSTAATGMKTVAANVGIEALTAVSKQNEERARGQAKPYIDNIRKIFLRRYKAQRTLRQSHEIAYANALEATRNASITYFKERLGKGQFSDVMFMLDELEKNSDAMFDASKKDAPGGIYDPSNLGFLHHSDVNALRTAALTQLREFERMKRMKNAQTLEGLKVQNAQIRFDADKLARNAILDMDEMQKLFDRTQSLITAGLPQAAETSSYLRGIVEKAERKYNKAQKDADKLQTEEDFDREYHLFNEALKGSAPMFYFAKSGVPTVDGKAFIGFASDEKGHAALVDGQNRMIMLIRNGLNRGILKRDEWKTRIKELEADRAKEDYYAAMVALEECGISFDEKATQDLIDARGGSYADMADERGGASESYTASKEDGRLRVANPNMMMYTWTDPVNGSKVRLSGLQLNDLLGQVAEWQKIHTNPSPSRIVGGVAVYDKPKELIDFINKVITKSAIREAKTHWFSADEPNGKTKGFGNMALVGHRVMEEYFSGKTTMRDLETRLARTELPSAKTVKESLENEKARRARNDGK